MSNIKVAYGSPTTIPITLAGLASNSARQSAAVNNTSNLYVDALIQVTISPVSPCSVYCYIFPSLDGVTFDGGVTGTDSAYSGDFSYGAPWAGNVYTQLNFSATATGTVASFTASGMYSGYGGYSALPPFWSLVLQNSGAGALTSGSVKYVGIYGQAS